MAVRPFTTVEEFEQIQAKPENQGRLLELINGEIIEKMPTEEHGNIAAWIATYLNLYLLQNPHIKGFTSVEANHNLEPDKRNAHLPDVSFIKGERQRVKKGSVRRMPDLAVEIKSPDDDDKLLLEKVNYYLKHGTQIVWIVRPDQFSVQVYRPEMEMVTLSREGTLDGGDLLPGFQLPVEKFLFED